MKKNIWTLIAATLQKHAPDVFKQVQVQLNEQAAAVKLAEVKTKEGKSISIEGELAKGSAAFMMNEAGEKVACPDGAYVLEDGSTLTVTGGLISDLVAAQAAAQGAGTAAPAAQTQPAAQFSKEDVEKILLEKLKERDDKITALTARFEKVEKTSALFAEVLKVIEMTEVDQPENAQAKRASAYQEHKKQKQS